MVNSLYVILIAGQGLMLKRIGMVLLVGMMMQGCAGRPLGVLLPVTSADVPGTTKVDMLVATTRAPSQDPGILFSGERADGLSMTDIKVSIPPDTQRQIGQVQWPKKLPANPAHEFATLSVRPITKPAEAHNWLRAHLPPSRKVIVFVHGFNNRYEDAVYRFAQIVHDAGAPIAPVLFTWPSRASVFDYNYDKESTNYSRSALENMLRRIARDPQVSDVTVMAHSMGTWLAMESLRQMAIRDGRIAAKIHNVVLASPDMDVEVFRRQWMELGTDRPRFTVFVSQDDRALKISRVLAGKVDRLGQINPNAEPYRSELTAAGITAIDLTALKSGDPLNHGKFADSPQVVQMIGARLMSGQTITDSDVGFGQQIGAVALGAAQTVGTAAGAAISAPIAVFDPTTRRSYGEQLGNVGTSAGNTVGAVTGR
jgi:esterase/lipase superfamily enzyme